MSDTEQIPVPRNAVIRGDSSNVVFRSTAEDHGEPPQRYVPNAFNRSIDPWTPNTRKNNPFSQLLKHVHQENTGRADLNQGQ